MDPIVVGVTGPSGAGKTYFANKIMKRFGTGSCIKISSDSYYKGDLSALPLAERDAYNFDHPDRLELSLLAEHLKQLKSGASVDIPEYDFATHERTTRTFQVDSKPIIIVEGILILQSQEIRELCDVSIYVKADLDICLMRRLERDMAERSRDAMSVIAQYKRDVRPMFKQFVEPCQDFASIVIENSADRLQMPAGIEFDIEPLIEHLHAARADLPQVTFRADYQQEAVAASSPAPLFVFIGGGAGSGKTTFSNMLNVRINASGKSSCIVKMDDYYHEIPDGVDIDYFRRNTNFDVEEALDLGYLLEHLTMLSEGQTIVKPIFDFITNKRLSTEEVAPTEVIIIEGLFALSFAKTLPDSIQKLTVYVGQSDYLDLLKARTDRDGRLRKLSASDVMVSERKTVGPSFFDRIAKSKNQVDYDITNDPQSAAAADHPLEEAVENIFEGIESRYRLNPGLR